MALAVLVVDRDAALQQRGQAGGIERLVEVDVEQGLGLVEQEAAVAVGAGDQRVARFGGQRQRPADHRLGALDQFASACSSSRRRISTWQRDSSAALSSKLGFSVVAPTSVTVPSST